MAIGNETVATLEQAAMESKGQDFLGIQLRSLLTDENRAELEPFVIAFEYLFVEQSAEEQRSRAEPDQVPRRPRSPSNPAWLLAR